MAKIDNFFTINVLFIELKEKIKHEKNAADKIFIAINLKILKLLRNFSHFY